MGARDAWCCVQIEQTAARCALVQHSARQLHTALLPHLLPAAERDTARKASSGRMTILTTEDLIFSFTPLTFAAFDLMMLSMMMFVMIDRDVDLLIVDRQSSARARIIIGWEGEGVFRSREYGDYRDLADKYGESKTPARVTLVFITGIWMAAEYLTKVIEKSEGCMPSRGRACLYEKGFLMHACLATCHGTFLKVYRQKGGELSRLQEVTMPEALDQATRTRSVSPSSSRRRRRRGEEEGRWYCVVLFPTS